MIERLKNRISASERQGGFTLIELLVVMIIIAILLAIAIPSYLGFRDRAAERTAQSNVRAAVPAAEAWYQDNSGTATDIDASAATDGYEGMTAALLKQHIDPGLATGLSVTSVTSSCYVLSATQGTKTAYVKGPGGQVVTAAPAACA